MSHTNLSASEIADLNMRVQRGYGELRALCAGRMRQTGDGQRGRDWTMTIPVRDSDSDVVLYDALKVADELLDRERARLSPVGDDTQ